VLLAFLLLYAGATMLPPLRSCFAASLAGPQRWFGYRSLEEGDEFFITGEESISTVDVWCTEQIT